MSESHKGLTNHVRPYPALYNVNTGEFIPSGSNLSKMCREKSLCYGKFWQLKAGNTRQTKDGWRLAAEKEADTNNR